MKHPNQEEWAPYVFGEADPKTRAELKKHLQECRDCREEIDRWKRTIKRLDKWHIAKLQRQVGMEWASPILRLAAAALLFIGIGYTAGHVLGQRSMRESLAVQIRQQVHQELAPEISAALGRTEARFAAELARQRDGILALVTEKVGQDTDRQIGELMQLWNHAREEDRRGTLTLFQQTQDQRTADYLSLRKDLETLALSTDEEVRHARERLIQLTSLSGK